MDKILVAKELLKIANELVEANIYRKARNFNTAEEFVHYLRFTLIPDLKESGKVETARDFEQVVRQISRKKADKHFISFLRGTLIPDLKESGSDATADDFEEAIEWLEEL
jgi:hypothetical protein